MKFTDGYWNLRPGVTPHFAEEIHEVKLEPDALTVYAVTKKLKSRGDTLNQALLTVRYSSPMPNVIRVQLAHHRGNPPKKPGFELKEQPKPELSLGEDAESATLSSGRLSVRVPKQGDWRVEFLDGDQPVTKSDWHVLGFVDTPEGRFVHEQLALGVGEYVYGLGERFTPFIKNGQVVDLWNEDGGTSSEQAYKNIPFYLTNRGYGVFINHPERVSLEIGSEKVERVQFSVPGEELDYFIIYGPSPKQVIERYTALTGRPALPPAWSFGLWLSTSFTTDYNEETVTSFIQGMADRDIPLQVFHFDCFWMKEFHWVDLKWDERVFPDPAGMLARLKARGLHICVWINPYIAQRSYLFDEGMEHGYLVKRPDSGVWQWDMWQAGMALVDFTNPAARQWFVGKLNALLDMGVDCFKTDFGERIPTDVVYYDGSDPVKMHNYYTHLYNQTVFELLEEKRGKGEAVLFARSATSGGQQFPVHWGGDSTASFDSMAETLRGGLSLALSGFGFWSHDIGGFEQTARPDLYKRWCAFGLLSSHSRLHGSQSYRVPWLFDEEAVEVLRFFTKQKCRLIPYLFQAACEAHQTGIPVMRAMLLEFPDDPTCAYLDRQYLLGASLLVAPVFRPDGIVEYYLPEGRWTNFISGKIVEGGRWLREQHDYLSLPLMVRPNTVIPLGSNETAADYDYADGVALHVFALDDGARCRIQVPTPQGQVGLTGEVSRQGSVIYAQIESATDHKPWQVVLRGIPAAQVQSVEGGNVQSGELGARINPEQAATRRLTIHLKNDKDL
jgi:alpha-D-xyloside xylohydrolase